jgi:hypothetical protein
MRNLFKHSHFLSLAFYFLLFASPAFANPPSNTAPLEKQELDDVVKNAVSAMTALVAEKKSACMRAFGDDAFCTCIAEGTPPGVNFAMYIMATTKSRDELGYDKLAPEDKKMFEATRQGRDKCFGFRSDKAGAAR